jgi:hypothetical protein
MKCYKHHELDAVGVCKNCNKGLCPECTADVDNGIACKNSCEQAVKDLNEAILRGKSIYKKTSATYYRLAAFYFLLGIFLILYPLLVDSNIANFLIPFGIIFLIAMAMMIYSGMKMKSKDE